VYSRSLTGAQRETAKVEEMVLRVCKGFTQGVHRGYKGGTQGVHRGYTGGTQGVTGSHICWADRHCWISQCKVNVRL